jgi:hypothetical protein
MRHSEFHVSFTICSDNLLSLDRLAEVELQKLTVGLIPIFVQIDTQMEVEPVSRGLTPGVLAWSGHVRGTIRYALEAPDAFS